MLNVHTMRCLIHVARTVEQQRLEQWMVQHVKQASCEANKCKYLIIITKPDTANGYSNADDADIVAFLYRDDYYDKESESKDIIEIIIAKHR